MTDSEVPPGVGSDDQVVLFDGVCKLCNGWAKFLIRHDHQRRFRLASVQSPQGQALLEWCGMPTDQYETLVLIRNGRVHVRSDAILCILGSLPMPWRLGAVGRVIPGPIRDWLYDRIARNRYRLFGRYDTCLVLTPDHRSRFLDE
ncbi:thiol-disulfide oxidoreductase DCC family protein [Marinobacter sp. M1N3S26]|uniref:thiol-disulfide oxidoreductase DCC family protein n=1 Tax=unclassified Marinobacter TaxID=83889 RepID=UPI00387B9BA2